MSTVKGRPFHPNHCNTQSCRLRRQWWHRVNTRIPKEGKETWKGLDQTRTRTQTPCLVSEAWGNTWTTKGLGSPVPTALLFVAQEALVLTRLLYPLPVALAGRRPMFLASQTSWVPVAVFTLYSQMLVFPSQRLPACFLCLPSFPLQSLVTYMTL